MKKIWENKLLSGALILSAGGLAAKIIGAVYRIPLTNIMGARGMGIYQLVFPMYALLLTVGSTGLNTAVSKLVAERYACGDVQGAKRLLFSAIKILGVLGVAGSLLLFFLGEGIAKAQGEPAAASAYRAIAPAVVLVCLIAAFRGYFQGRQKMSPTALSQVIEQLVKMAFSLLAATYYMPDIAAAATGAVWAVTISEGAALVYLIIVYLTDKEKNQGQEVSQNRETKLMRQLLLLALPITLSGIILPVTQFVDSGMVLNIVGKYTADATVLYGLLSGPVASLIALPVAISLGFAAAALPALSRARAQKDWEGVAKKSGEAVRLTLLFCLPAAAGVFVFASPVINFLYRALSAEERLIAVSLLKIGSLNVVFLPLLSTATSVLQAGGKIYTPVKNLGIAAAVKILCNLILLRQPSINIYGAAISTAICYMTAAGLDLLSMTKNVKQISVRAKCDIIQG